MHFKLDYFDYCDKILSFYSYPGCVQHPFVQSIYSVYATFPASQLLAILMIILTDIES